MNEDEVKKTKGRESVGLSLRVYLYGVTNIYAPNNSNEHCILWAKMIQKLPRDCRRILLVIGIW